jgi:hypothetical protein
VAILVVGDLVLHLGDAFSLLVDSLHLIIKLFLFFEISHFVTIGFILEIFGAIFFGQKGLPELSNLFHDI